MRRSELGNLSVLIAGFDQLAQRLLAHAGGRVVAVLEGSRETE